MALVVVLGESAAQHGGIKKSSSYTNVHISHERMAMEGRAIKRGGRIVYLFRHRTSGVETPTPVRVPPCACAVIYLGGSLEHRAAADLLLGEGPTRQVFLVGVVVPRVHQSLRTRQAKFEGAAHTRKKSSRFT